MANFYVDGESHFIRIESCLQKLHGAHLALEAAVYTPKAVGTMSYPDESRPILRVDRACKFFWDRQYVAFFIVVPKYWTAWAAWICYDPPPLRAPPMPAR
jgi:hypothetical protein